MFCVCLTRLYLWLDRHFVCYICLCNIVPCIFYREKRLEQLQQQYPESRGWDATSLALRTAVAVLCSCKVSMLQLHVEHLVRLHSYTKWLQTSLGDTSRKETKKLELEKNRLYQQISDDLRSAVEWETQRQRYKEHMPSDTAGMYDQWLIDCHVGRLLG